LDNCNLNENQWWSDRLHNRDYFTGRPKEEWIKWHYFYQPMKQIIMVNVNWDSKVINIFWMSKALLKDWKRRQIFGMIATSLWNCTQHVWGNGGYLEIQYHTTKFQLESSSIIHTGSIKSSIFRNVRENDCSEPKIHSTDVVLKMTMMRAPE